MKLADLDHLRWSILFSLLLALPGVIAVILAIRFMNASLEEHRQAQSERTTIQRRFAQVGFDGKLLERKLARYRELLGHGYIGQEQRLEWIEEIASISKQRHLLDLRYELSPQQPLDIARGDAYVASSSNMKLQMQLLHEEDLINFLADLSARVHAYIRINSCRVERLPLSAGEGRLQADCSLDWITFREKP